MPINIKTYFITSLVFVQTACLLGANAAASAATDVKTSAAYAAAAHPAEVDVKTTKSTPVLVGTFHCLKKIKAGQPCEHMLTTIKSEFLSTITDQQDESRCQVMHARLLAPQLGGTGSPGQIGEAELHIKDLIKNKLYQVQYNMARRTIISFKTIQEQQ